MCAPFRVEHIFNQYPPLYKKAFAFSSISVSHPEQCEFLSKKRFFTQYETFEKPGDFHPPQKDNGLF